MSHATARVRVRERDAAAREARRRPIERGVTACGGAGEESAVELANSSEDSLADDVARRTRWTLVSPPLCASNSAEVGVVAGSSARPSSHSRRNASSPRRSGPAPPPPPRRNRDGRLSTVRSPTTPSPTSPPSTAPSASTTTSPPSTRSAPRSSRAITIAAAAPRSRPVRGALRRPPAVRGHGRRAAARRRQSAVTSTPTAASSSRGASTAPR